MVNVRLITVRCGHRLVILEGATAGVIAGFSYGKGGRTTVK